MKNVMVVLLTIVVLAFAGCTQKPDAQPVSESRDTGASSQVALGSAHGQAPSTADPHATMKPQETAMGADHKAKVVSAVDASGYTYVEVEENGKKLWIAVMQTEVKPGDEVVFPDSPPVENFHSKALNRTFEKIILVPAIQVNGKPGKMGAHPKVG
jgi:hypothetical protein